MLIIRPIGETDLTGLVGLAKSTGGGLTTLPPDKEFLAERIDNSLRAFSPRVHQPGGELYLFALEDTATGDLLGVSGIASRVGGFEPWYSYEIKPERLIHQPLHVDKEIPVLHLRQEHRGPSEICSLFLRADRRRGGAGRLLSLSRFLFIGAQRKRFTATIIAEMRGYIDQTGRSPFWEAVGRHFFPFDFYAADVLSGLHPIYLPLLSAEVRTVVGRVHHETEPALALLLAEGFERTNEVDIFDAGPLIRAETDKVRTLRTARTARFQDTAELPVDATTWLLANSNLDFRATLGAVRENPDDTVSLAPDTAAALHLAPGDKIWISPLR